MHPSNTNSTRKRARSTTTAAASVFPLATALLWLVAFTSTYPSSVKAFVVASDRPTVPRYSSNKRQLQHQRLIHVVDHDASQQQHQPLFSAAAATLVAPPSPGSDFHDALSTLGGCYDDDLWNFDDCNDLQYGLSPALLDLSSLIDVPTNNDDFFDMTHHYNGQQEQLLVPPSPHNKFPDEDQVLEWAHRYTSVDALREHFGGNQNKLWGDLQASTARRLYKTLLPRALLDLSKLGTQLQPQDLAPLAYQARVAAKMYARERCTVPARIAATLFDGFRQWMKYGKFQGNGMTYDQLWEKYAEKILHETEHHHVHHHAHRAVAHDRGEDEDDEECDPHFDSDDEEEEDEEDISELVCRKILERACVSNESVDSYALKGQHWADDTLLQPDQRQLLERIRSQLEEDMYQLLIPGDEPKNKDMSSSHKSVHHQYHRNPLQEGKYRLVKGLIKQRRYWKLRQQKKLLEKAVAKDSHQARSQMASRSTLLDHAEETDTENDAAIAGI